MNKILTFNGEQPIHLDDIRFIQDTYTQGFADLLKSVAKDVNCILWGCETSGTGTVTISEGAVWIDNEIYHVPTQTITIIAGDYIDIIPDITEESLRIFGDSTTHNVWQIRKGKAVIDNPGTPSHVTLGVSPHLIDIIREHQQGTWRFPSYNTAPGSTNYGISRPYCNPLKFRKTTNGYLEFDGGFYSDADGGLVFTLPTGYRPSETKFIHTAYIGNNSAVETELTAIIKIETNGNVYLINADGLQSGGYEVILSTQFVSLN